MVFEYSVYAPFAIFPFPTVFASRALVQSAIFPDHVVLAHNELLPRAIFPFPVVFLLSDSSHIAIL